MPIPESHWVYWGSEPFLALLAGFCSVFALFAAGYGHARITLAGNWWNLYPRPKPPQSAAGRLPRLGKSHGGAGRSGITPPHPRPG